jgi:hypothetical protein
MTFYAKRERGIGSPFLEALRRRWLAWPQCQAQPYTLFFDSSNGVEESIDIPLSCGEKHENVLDSAVRVMKYCEFRTRKGLWSCWLQEMKMAQKSCL